jgi:hypothetical protein
MHGHFILQTKY